MTGRKVHHEERQWQGKSVCVIGLSSYTLALVEMCDMLWNNVSSVFCVLCSVLLSERKSRSVTIHTPAQCYALNLNVVTPFSLAIARISDRLITQPRWLF